MEESDYLRSKKCTAENLARKRERFGTICFISNMELDLRNVYEYYMLRWEIETVFRAYKGIMSLNTTREHDNYSVIGSEFINYLSVTMVCRMKNVITEKELFKDYTFKEIMDRLDDCIKTNTTGKENGWRMCSLSKKDQELLSILGL